MWGRGTEYWTGSKTLQTAVCAIVLFLKYPYLRKLKVFGAEYVTFFQTMFRAKLQECIKELIPIFSRTNPCFCL